MTQNDPERDFAVEVVQRLTGAGYTALWAGGCVRDFLLGRLPKDYDVATNALPDQVRQVFGNRRTLTVGASFGVIVVLGPKEAGQIEVATFRSDGDYLDGRHPSSVSFSTPEEDAKRRDFTINGMFYDPLDRKVLDFVGGESDLNARIVRAIGNPQERMNEDKLRMLRAVRFTANLDFELDQRTAEAIRGMASEIRVVSVERISQELKRILVNANRLRGLKLSQEVGLLEVMLPELEPVISNSVATADSMWEQTLRMLAALDAPAFELAVATLFLFLKAPDVVRSTCRRLRLSNDETDRIEWLVGHQDDLDRAADLSLARLKRTLSHRYANDLLELMRVQTTAVGRHADSVEFCEEFLRRTPSNELDPPALLTGDDLIADGLRPGKQFQQILETVRDAQLNGEICSKSDAVQFVRQLTGGPSADK